MSDDNVFYEHMIEQDRSNRNAAQLEIVSALERRVERYIKLFQFFDSTHIYSNSFKNEVTTKLYELIEGLMQEWLNVMR